MCCIEKQSGNSLKAHLLSDSLVSFSEDWRISCLQADGDLLWIGSNRGLFKYNHAERSLKRYRYSTHRPGMLSQLHLLRTVDHTGVSQVIPAQVIVQEVVYRYAETVVAGILFPRVTAIRPNLCTSLKVLSKLT